MCLCACVFWGQYSATRAECRGQWRAEGWEQGCVCVLNTPERWSRFQTKWLTWFPDFPHSRTYQKRWRGTQLNCCAWEVWHGRTIQEVSLCHVTLLFLGLNKSVLCGLLPVCLVADCVWKRRLGSCTSRCNCVRANIKSFSTSVFCLSFVIQIMIVLWIRLSLNPFKSNSSFYSFEASRTSLLPSPLAMFVHFLWIKEVTKGLLDWPQCWAYTVYTHFLFLYQLNPDLYFDCVTTNLTYWLNKEGFQN